MTTPDHTVQLEGTAAAPRPTASAAARMVQTSIGFSLVFLGSSLAALLAAVCLNAIGAGTKLFPSPGFPPSTCLRAWKARRAEQLARSADPPQTLVMGSSRVFALEEADVQALTGKPAFNFGVSVGCPIDFLAQLRFAIHAGLTPRTLVVGIDELAFGDNPQADFYDMQLVTHGAVFRELALREQIPILLRIFKTISLPSTRESVQNLWRRWGQQAVFPEGELEPTRPPNWDNLSVAEQKAHLATGIDRLAAFWGQYLNRPDKVEGMRPGARKLRLWEDLLDLAAAQGMEVYVVLLPVHPEFERRTFSPRLLAIRGELAATLERSARRHGFTFRDYTQLASFGGDPGDFEDGTHMTPANGRRLLTALLARRPQADP